MDTHKLGLRTNKGRKMTKMLMVLVMAVMMMAMRIRTIEKEKVTDSKWSRMSLTRLHAGS